VRRAELDLLAGWIRVLVLGRGQRLFECWDGREILGPIRGSLACENAVERDDTEGDT
jgi:hypothetical protein